MANGKKIPVARISYGVPKIGVPFFYPHLNKNPLNTPQKGPPILGKPPHIVALRNACVFHGHLPSQVVGRNGQDTGLWEHSVESKSTAKRSALCGW